MPEEVRGEIEPYFVDSPPIVEEDNRKLPKLDDTADFIRTGLSVCQLFLIVFVDLSFRISQINYYLYTKSEFWTGTSVISHDGTCVNSQIFFLISHQNYFVCWNFSYCLC